MEEEQQQKIARFVGEKILESCKNGIATGRLTGSDTEAKRQSATKAFRCISISSGSHTAPALECN